MSACFRRRVIAFLPDRNLVDERPAKNMLQWAHSGFSAVVFLVELLRHVPHSRCRLIRTYGLYSSRALGTPATRSASEP